MPIGKVNAEFLVNATTLGNQDQSSVTALADGRFLVTWSDWSQSGLDTSSLAVRGRLFNADGSPAWTEFMANSTTPGTQFQSSASALPNGNILITWTDGSTATGDTSGAAIRGRIVNVAGGTAVPEFVVATTTFANQTQSSTTVLPDGRFVVTWSDDSQTGGDTNSIAVRAKVFNQNGTAASPEILINTTTAGVQWDSQVSALADGRFIVTWTDFSQTGGDQSGKAVRSRIFNPDGSQFAPEFIAATTTANDQSDASVTALSGGRFVVTWTDSSGTGADGSGSAVRGRVFNADGTEAAPEFIVNSTTVGDQSESSVAALADGRFVVTWTDTSAIGPDFVRAAIRSRVFNEDGTASSPEFVVNTTTEGAQSQSKVTTLADGRFVVTWTDESYSGGDTSGFAIRAQVFDPTIYDGDAESETITGGSGADRHNGFAGDDRMEGRAGNDTLLGGDGFDTLIGDAGDDRLDGGAESDSLVGGSGNDTLIGRTGLNAIEGGDGDDLIIGGSGADTIDGGAGSDTLSYASSAQGVKIHLAFSNGSAIDPSGTLSDAWNDTFVNVENIIGSLHADQIIGSAGANSLSGGAGDDTLVGAQGADSLLGGAGNDWLFFDADDTVVIGGDGYDIAVSDGQSAHGFAMAANGIEELQWAQSGDSYVASRNLATGDIRVVTTDQGLVNSEWSSFTTDYTANWVAKVQTGTYDAGGSWTINYDFANNQNFTSYTTVYKAGAVLWYQSGTYDDGTTWSTNWDTENAGNWTQYTTQYDTQGRATAQYGTYDDGTSWTINWDVANAGNWAEYTTIYRANGSLWYQTGVYDNGQTWTILF